MNLSSDPRALRLGLRAKRSELNSDFTYRSRVRELESQCKCIEDFLDKLCGDHDVKTPEAWRAQRGLIN